MNLLNVLSLNILCSGEPLFPSMPLELVYVIRTLVGGLLGLLIGFERRRRQKEAGIATHFVVGSAATLFTCMSIYFKDIGDGERIAAQVVSGVGFLGAGMIFFRRESLRGLTTAAGIWATAAIGMCVAGGLYWIACGVTGIIILVQILLHSKFIRRNRQHLLFVKMEYSDEVKEKLMEFFGFEAFHRFKVTSTSEKFATDAHDGAPKQGDTTDTVTVSQTLIAETVIYPKQNCSADAIAEFIRQNPQILSIERLEDL